MTHLLLAQDNDTIKKVKTILTHLNDKLLIFKKPDYIINIIDSLDPDNIIINTRDFFEDEIESVLNISKNFPEINFVILGNIDKIDYESKFQQLDLDCIHFCDNLIHTCKYFNNTNKIIFTHPVTKRLLTGTIIERSKDSIIISSDYEAETSTLAINTQLTSCTFYNNDNIIIKDTKILSNNTNLELKIL